MLVRSCEELHAVEFAQQIAQFELELACAAPPKNGSVDSVASEWKITSALRSMAGRCGFHEYAGIITPGVDLLELGDPTDLEIEVDALSTDAVKIQPGAHAQLLHWGRDEPLEGRVRLIEPAALKISALGVEEQWVNVILDFADDAAKKQPLGDAYRVEAQIVAWHGDSVLKVPGSALFRHQEQWSVFEVVHGVAHLQPVEIGQRNDLEAENSGPAGKRYRDPPPE